jgi:cellobiose-specific phosphotransferase system component IIC
MMPPGSGPTIGAGEVAAADGSIITWTTAADGQITATGHNQQLVITRDASVQQIVFSGSGATYLTVTTSFLVPRSPANDNDTDERGPVRT